MINLDGAIENGLKAASMRMSRRRIGALLGKVAIAVTGATAVQILPLDKRVPEVDAQGVCCTWYYRGMNGKPCEACQASNGPCACPSVPGLVYGGAWWMCVYNPYNGYCYDVLYQDCCGQFVGCPFSCNNSGAPVWCNGYGYNYYGCTITCILGACYADCYFPLC